MQRASCWQLPLHDKSGHGRQIDRFPLPRPSTPFYPMRKAIFTVVSLLAAVTSTYARAYPRAPIDDATLTKVRANAITSSQRRWVPFSLFGFLPLTYRRISAGKLVP